MLDHRLAALRLAFLDHDAPHSGGVVAVGEILVLGVVEVAVVAEHDPLRKRLAAFRVRARDGEYAPLAGGGAALPDVAGVGRIDAVDRREE